MKKKRGSKLKINISNRWLYTFIILGILAIISVGVYAYASSNGIGHEYTEIKPCSGGQILKTNSAGTAWECAAAPTSQWTTSGNNIYYNTGNVGIGIVSPEVKVQVAGSIRAADDITANHNIIAQNEILGGNIIATQNVKGNTITATGVVQGNTIKVLGGVGTIEGTCSEDKYGQIGMCNSADWNERNLCVCVRRGGDWNWDRIVG